MEATGRDTAHIELGGATDIGRRREHNEDAWTVFLADVGDAWQVAVVADGMGGHNAGEVASAIAIEVIERELGTTSGGSRTSPADEIPSAGTVRADGAAVAFGAAGVSGSSTAEPSADAASAADVGWPDESARSVASAQPDVSTQPAHSAATADPARALAVAIERANRAIWDEAQRDPSRSGMGTTVVGAIFAGTRAYLANVGDSPAILVRDGESRQVTRDHGWVAEQVEAGLIDPQDAPYHPYRNILTRCLGTERSVAVEVYAPLNLLPGDQLVLCSDGLTAHVAVEEVGPLVTGATPTDTTRLLIDLANERGGQDNITVVVARVVGA